MAMASVAHCALMALSGARYRAFDIMQSGYQSDTVKSGWRQAPSSMRKAAQVQPDSEGSGCFCM